MKKYTLFTLLAISLLFPAVLSAQVNYNTTDGYFKYQKDVEQTLSHDGTRKMATISYNGKLFNFVNYYLDDDKSGKIIVRDITNSGGMTPEFSVKKYDDIATLESTRKSLWQPAPVIFKDILYLYTSNGMDYKEIDCFKYDSKKSTMYKAWDSGEWRVFLPGYNGDNFAKVETGMAAVVLDDRLCLLFKDANAGYLNAAITEDPESGNYVYQKIIEEHMPADADITAITTSRVLNGKKSSVLTYAFIDTENHPRTSSFYLDDQKKLVPIYQNKLITIESTFSSVALIEGTVKGDNASSGHCIQAFLKRNATDNSNAGMYRIEQFQLKDDVWAKKANNLLPQTSPKHLWACKKVNLTATFVPVNNSDNITINQLMCLFYMGFDTQDYPLNCAYVETDYLKYTSSIKINTYAIPGDENKQYIGYVEGPPPFHVNDSTAPDPLGTFDSPISEISFSTSDGTTTTEESKFNIKGSAKVHIGPFKAGLNAAYGEQQTTDYSKTILCTIKRPAGSAGVYIALTPIIVFQPYIIYDQLGNKLDTTYYGVMGDPRLDLIEEPLKDGLKPSDPTTYLNCPHDNYNAWIEPAYSYGSEPVSWTGSGSTSKAITINQSNTLKNTKKAEANVEIGPSFLNVGVDADIEYQMESETVNGNEIKCTTHLKTPVATTDVTKIDYTFYWLKPNFDPDFGNSNWWLHSGGLDQETWCVAYRVTSLVLVNGTHWGSKKGNENDPDPVVGSENRTSNETRVSKGDFALFQNYPNPARKSTVIKYQVGSTEASSGSSTGGNGSITRLKVFNVQGQVVATLVDEVKQPGSYQAEWNTLEATPGVYLYSLESGSFKEVKRMIVLR